MRCQGVGNSANDRKLIRTLGQFWKMLRDFHSSDLRFHGRELPTDFSRRVGFGIEKIQVTRTTIEPNQNTGSRLGGLVPMSAWGGCSESTSMEKLAQTHSQRREATNTNKISACDSVTSLEKTHDSSTFID